MHCHFTSINLKFFFTILLKKLITIYFRIIVIAIHCINVSSYNKSLGRRIKHVLPLDTILQSLSGTQAVLGQFKHNVFICKPSTTFIDHYESICAGNIISIDKVLTSAHCVLTNRKRLRYQLISLRVVGGVLNTLLDLNKNNDTAQWRRVSYIRSQKYFRFPYYNLAILVIYPHWIFNKVIKSIPFARRDQDFNGRCNGIALRATKSWNTETFLHNEVLMLIRRQECESAYARNMLLFICTGHDSWLSLARQDVEGGGLVCRGTGDPKEENEEEGVLVGVHTCVNIYLPSLHTKIGIFYKWINDEN